MILARVNGEQIAVAFLIPHRANRWQRDLALFVIPVRTVQTRTSVNIMLEMGANDALETRSDTR